MGRRGRPPGTPEGGQGPEGAQDASNARPSAGSSGEEPTFQEIFGTPTGSTPTSGASRPAEPIRPAAAETDATPVDALAAAVASPASETPWATASSAASEPAGARGRDRAPRERGAARAPRRRASRGGIAILAIVVLVVGGLAAGGWALFGGAIMDRFAEPEDYAGTGEGEVVVRIEQGWTGAQVATMLEEEGVIADQAVFYDLLVDDPSIGFQPGAYRVALEMSSQAALDALQDPASRAVLQATIPEGFLIDQVYARLAEQTGIAEADFVQAGTNFQQFGLPADAVSLEGWLFPATYTFEDGATAESILQTMVDRMRQALAEQQVPEADWQRVVTFASLIQREAGPVENFGRVARVFQNRLDIGMLLQSDATVAYGTGNTDLITTTDEERGDANNPYNTYLFPGLPIGPIGAPGDAAIAAALAPEPGDWLYFVTTNPDTGETVFSATFAEHQEAVLLFQAWLRENPEYGG